MTHPYTRLDAARQRTIQRSIATDRSTVRDGADGWSAAEGWLGMRPEKSLRFADRQEAGHALADQVEAYLTDQKLVDRPLVLGMSRGGVPVAVEVAKALGGDLDIIVTTRIGLPWRAEHIVGALAENGPVVIDYDALAGGKLSVADLGSVVQQQRLEITRQVDLFREGRSRLSVTDRVVIVVDDGMQTGIRARAALRALHADIPAHLVFATPIAAAESFDRLAVEADGLVHVRCPCCFNATGLWYHDLQELNDVDVVETLRRAWTPTAVV